MEVYLNATSVNKNLWPLIENEPVALIKLADKYLIEYLFESCVRSGIKSVNVIGGRYCDILKHKLGTGNKWGLIITYQDTINVSNDSFLIHADSLYNIDLTELINISVQNCDALSTSAPVTSDTNHRNTNRTQLSDQNDHTIFRIDDYSSYYSACMKLVRNQLKECVIDPHQAGYKVIEGSRISYNQESITNGYAFIGDRTRIAPTSTVSSDVLIGADVVIDDYAQLNRCIVLDSTYIGKMLKVEHSIVKGNYLISLKNNTCTTISDDLLISDLSTKPGKKRLIQRFTKLTEAV